MSLELLELPDEFEGLPDRTIRAAQARAESLLPSNIVAHLGQERAEQVLVAATCHVLTVTRAGTGDTPLPVPVEAWTGSAYGQEVKQALSLMPKPTGRTRVYPFSSTEP